MAFITTAAMTAYLRLETADEYAIVDMLYTSSLAQIAAYINRPVAAKSASYVINTESDYTYGTATALALPVFPFSPTSLSIIGYSGNQVSSSNYYTDSDNGMVVATTGNVFSDTPYTISAVVGLQTDPDYSNKYEPIINQAILDLVSVRFNQRNPDVKTDIQGDIQQTYSGLDMPPSTKSLLNLIRAVGIVR